MSKMNDTTKEKFDLHSKPLDELIVDTEVLCQNTQSCKWCKSGVVVDTGSHRQYYVKMDGSGRISLINRKHLRPILLSRPMTPVAHNVKEVADHRNDVNDEAIPKELSTFTSFYRTVTRSI